MCEYGSGRPVAPLGRPPGHRENQENVQDHAPSYPSDGFGQLWHKRLSVEIPCDSNADEVMSFWRERLVELWPASGEVFLSHSSLRPGDLLGIDVTVGPATLSTGVIAIESSERALALLSPEGHMFAGWTRLATDVEIPGTVTASVTIEMRAGDPLYELGLFFGGHRREERFWAELLRNLAAHYGSPGRVRLRRRLLDRKRQWRRTLNLRHNVLLRSSWRRVFRLFRVVPR